MCLQPTTIPAQRQVCACCSLYNHPCRACAVFTQSHMQLLHPSARYNGGTPAPTYVVFRTARVSPSAEPTAQVCRWQTAAASPGHFGLTPGTPPQPRHSSQRHTPVRAPSGRNHGRCAVRSQGPEVQHSAATRKQAESIEEMEGGLLVYQHLVRAVLQGATNHTDFLWVPGGRHPNRLATHNTAK
jgi:hypothetical protein